MQASISLPPNNRQSQKGRLAGKKNQKKKKQRKGKKGAKPKTPTKANANYRRAVARVEKFKLSQCSTLYLKALTDPFNLEGGVACIPDEFDIPSFKCLSVTRGTMALGNLGVGFVCVKHQPTSDETAIIATNGVTFTGTTVTAVALANGVTAYSNVGAPFVASQFSGGSSDNAYMWRLVGGGLRIRYLGTELNRSGREIPYRKNTLVNIVGFNAAQLLSRPEVPSIATRREWATVTHLPLGSVNIGSAAGQISDYEYNPETVAAFGTGAAGVFADLGFFIDGGVAGNAYEWEWYQHYEIAAIRGASPAGITPSHADLPGISAIRNVLESNMPSGETPESDFQYYANLIRSYAPADMSHVLSEVVKVGKVAGPLLF